MPANNHSFSPMPPLSNEVPHFFKSVVPPPTLPILIAQTEIGYNQAPPKPLALEELGPGAARRHLTATGPYPYHKSAPHNSTNVISDSGSSSGSDSSIDSDSDNDDIDGVQLIPKPTGEAGRPGRGGYNLEESLGWPAKEYRQLKVADSDMFIFIQLTLFIRNL
jgi:hypothetical protein